MNKQSDNKLALSVVATLTAGIALVYTFIAFPKQIFPIAGVSAIFLICAYLLTQNIVSLINMRNKSLNVQIKSGMDDLANQLEGMSSAQAQLGKATYLYTRQAAENVATLKGNYADSQEALFKNLSVLANAQNKSTKLLIKYDQNNTTKLISTLKDIKNNINDTMTQGFDQAKPNNSDVVAMLESIVDYLKTQPGTMDQSLGMQINNVAHELQNISSSIVRAQQIPMGGMMPGMGMPIQPAPQVQPAYSPSPEPQFMNEPIPAAAPIPDTQPSMDIANPMADIPEMAGESSVNDAAPDTAYMDTGNMSEEQYADDAADLSAPIEAETVIASDEPDSITEAIPEVQPEPEIAAEAEPEPVTIAPVSDDPNKQLSNDEIAALFASAGSAPQVEEASPAPEPVAVTPVSDDPNKQLSTDEIAALFAAAEPAPKKEEPAPEPVAVTPVSDDPNKQLSADEIAALFAASGSATADEATAPVPAEEEPFTPTFTVVGKSEPSPEPVNVTPASDDPNKQLSADEIAALFAAAEPAPKKEEPAPAPEPVAPVSDDPNKQLSADEIAALFAAAEPAPKKEEPSPAPEPVAVTPVSDDPNKQLSPDEIAALFASIG